MRPADGRTVAPRRERRLGVEVVDLSAEGRRAWLGALQEVEGADVYFHPAYAEVLQRNGEGEARCALVSGEHGGRLLFPYLVRPLPEDLRRRAGLPPESCDVVTPYGYGGPLVEAASEEQAAQLHGTLRRWASERFPAEGVVSEFIRYHPLLENHRWATPEVRQVRRSHTVAIDLRIEPEGRWQEMTPKCRNKVRRAQSAGVVVEEDPEFHHLEAFQENYQGTMRRTGAAPGYFYPMRFFLDLVERLAGHVTLFVARDKGLVVNAALILHRGRFVHYHLSGSHPARRIPGANNLLLHEVARWARARGARWFHLGGGRQPDDSLFQFKASFSSLRPEFWTGGAIHDPGAYRRLREAAAAAGREPEPSFFPAYRG